MFTILASRHIIRVTPSSTTVTTTELEKLVQNLLEGSPLFTVILVQKYVFYSFFYHLKIVISQEF